MATLCRYTRAANLPQATTAGNCAPCVFTPHARHEAGGFLILSKLGALCSSGVFVRVALFLGDEGEGV